MSTLTNVYPDDVSERIDPSSGPQRTLTSGSSMPGIGIGTFGSDHVSPEQVAQAVKGAAEVGYRHFDCAAVYGNEAQIGGVFTDILGSGIRRSDLWITSKLWNDKHAEADVIPTCRKTLNDLQLDHLDLYLVHWPFPNFHPPGCDVSSRSAAARPYIHDNYMKTWRQMEQLVELGLVRNIGTSNMTIPKLKLVLRDAAIKPVVNEMELHPHFQQPELFQFALDHGIQPVGFCPLGSPGRPDRDRTPEDTDPLQDPVIQEIARNHGVHPATICIKWAAQRGQIPIPFSTKRRNYLANLQSTVTAPLSDAEAALRQCDPEMELLWSRSDGQEVAPGDRVLECQGSARGILAAERTALNFLQQLSGVATQTRSAVDQAGSVRVLDTRKTVPLLRDAQKEAVLLGGGENHRRDLEDQLLLKENHFALSGLGYAETVAAAIAASEGRQVGVEAETLEQALAALEAGAAYVLLDNFKGEALREVVACLRERFPHAELEASGRLRVSSSKPFDAENTGRPESRSSKRSTVARMNWVGTTL